MKKANARRAIIHSTINWFLWFLQADISSLPAADLAKLLHNFHQYVFGIPTIGPLAVIPTTIAKPADFRVSKKNIERIRKFQTTFRDFFEGFYINIKKGIPYDSDPWVSKSVVFSLKGTINSVQIVEPEETQVVLRFLEIISGMPVSSIKQCMAPSRHGECGKYFSHFTKREKRYCGGKCSARALATEIRKDIQDDPERHEKYKAEQRKRMKAIYKRKRKEKEVRKKTGIRISHVVKVKIEKAREKIKS